MHARPGIGPDKTGVFPRANFGERVPLPEFARVTETRAIDTWFLARRIHVLPGPLFLARVEPNPAQSANVRRLCAKLVYLIPKPPRGAPVIVIPMHQHFTARRPAGEVTLHAHGLARFTAKVSNARIVRHQIRDGVRPVINYNEFPLRIILREKPPDRPRHKAPPVCRGHDARDE